MHRSTHGVGSGASKTAEGPSSDSPVEAVVLLDTGPTVRRSHRNNDTEMSHPVRQRRSSAHIRVQSSTLAQICGITLGME